MEDIYALQVAVKHHPSDDSNVWGLIFSVSTCLEIPGELPVPVQMEYVLHHVGSVEYETWMAFLGQEDIVKIDVGPQSWIIKSADDKLLLATDTSAVGGEDVQNADMFMCLPAALTLEAMTAALEKAVADGYTFAGDE